MNLKNALTQNSILTSFLGEIPHSRPIHFIQSLVKTMPYFFRCKKSKVFKNLLANQMKADLIDKLSKNGNFPGEHFSDMRRIFSILNSLG